MRAVLELTKLFERQIRIDVLKGAAAVGAAAIAIDPKQPRRKLVARLDVRARVGLCQQLEIKFVLLQVKKPPCKKHTL